MSANTRTTSKRHNNTIHEFQKRSIKTVTRFSDVTVETNPKILQKTPPPCPHRLRVQRALLAVPPPRRSSSHVADAAPTPPAAPHRPCSGAVPAKRNESACDATHRGHPWPSRRDGGGRQTASPRLWEGPALRQHNNRGRCRRLLPLEVGTASVLLGKGMSLAGGVACVASRPPRRVWGAAPLPRWC